MTIPKDKVAACQVLENGGEAVSVNTHAFADLRTCKAFLVVREQLNQLHITLCIGKERVEELVKLDIKNRIALEEEAVNILHKTLFCIQQAPIERHTAQYHVSLHNLIPIPCAFAFAEIALRFLQREGAKIDIAGDTAMQTALVLNEVVHHPTGRTSASNK